jgi:glutamyl-tRNA synthetase
MQENVRVRFAPSPTGALHIGGGHTALFNWLWARRTGGTFVLRIEDTDLQRSTAEYENTIMEGMRWLGLDWDEGPDKGGNFGPYRQSERLEIYRKYAEQLLEEGKAYREGEAIIYRLPQEERVVAFDDMVYGHIEIPTSTYKDIVLMKSDGTATYNFAVVVDDYTMDITYVIRGEDHIMNTPKQILLYEALGWRLPKFAHLPMILGKDKKKLSKRQGATSVYEYRDLGYIPDGVFNFLALLGWSPGDDEVITREEAVKIFDLSRVAKRAAVFDTDKLGHINQEHLWRLPKSELLAHVRPHWEALNLPANDYSPEYLEKALTLLDGRGQTTQEIAAYSDYFLSFAAVCQRYDASDLDEKAREVLQPFLKAMLELPSWSDEELATFAKAWAEEKNVKMKALAMPLRFALTGMKVSPGIFELAVFFGKDEVRRRLEHYGLV